MSDYKVQDLVDNINYLQETKNLIKQSIIDKGQSILDSDTFRSYADYISNIESVILDYTSTTLDDTLDIDYTTYLDNIDTQIGNIVMYKYEPTTGNDLGKTGVVMFRVLELDGSRYKIKLIHKYINDKKIYSDDLTATSNTIQEGYTALVKDEVVTGTLPVVNNISDEFPKKIDDNTLKKDVDSYIYTYPFNNKTIVENNTNFKINIPFNTLAGIINLTPDKLARGYQILNIDGTYNDQVKRFNTYEEMIANTDQEDEQLAIVYNDNNFNGLYKFNLSDNSWSLAPTQFEAKDEDVMAVPYYGANGVSIGTFNQVKYITDQNKGDIYTWIKKFDDWSQLFDTSNVTNMSRLFYNKRDLTHYTFAGTENVMDTSFTFTNCTNLKILENTANLNLCNSNTAYEMFSNCSNLTILNLCNLNLCNSIRLGYMFYSCSNLIDINLCNANFSNAGDLQDMFDSCDMLRKIDLSNAKFNYDKILNSYYQYSGMFDRCYNLVELKLPGGFFNQFSNRDTVKFSFLPDATNLHELYDGNTSVYNIKINNVKNLYLNTFMYNCFNLYQTIDFNIYNSNITRLNQIYGKFNYYIDNCNFSNIVLNNCNIVKFYVNNCNIQYANTLRFNSSNINALHFEDVNFIENNVLNCVNLFRDTVIRDLNFDLSGKVKVSGFSHMFEHMRNIVYATFNFYDSDVIDDELSLDYMFARCNTMTNIPRMNPSLFTSRAIVTTECMFKDCSNITVIGLQGSYSSDWYRKYNMSQVKSTAYMFENCRALKTGTNVIYNDNGECFPVVTNMANMFANCGTIFLGEYNLFTSPYLENVSGMFYNIEHYGFYNIKLSDLVNKGTVNFTNILTNALIPYWNVGLNDCTISTNNYLKGILYKSNVNAVNLSNLTISNNSFNLFNLFGIYSQPVVNCCLLNLSNANMDSLIYTSSSFTNLYETFNVNDINLSNANINSFNLPLNRSTILNSLNFSGMTCNNFNINLNGCTNLTKVDFENCHIKIGKNFSRLLDNSYRVTELNLSSVDFTNTERIGTLAPNLTEFRINSQGLNNLKYAGGLVWYCNNLSDESIQNIINLCLNAPNITYKNLSNASYDSVFGYTNITNARYTNRLVELTEAGWNF